MEEIVTNQSEENSLNADPVLTVGSSEEYESLKKQNEYLRQQNEFMLEKLSELAFQVEEIRKNQFSQERNIISSPIPRAAGETGDSVLSKEKVFPAQEEALKAKQDMSKSQEEDYKAKQEMSPSKEEMFPSKEEMYQSNEELFPSKEEMFPSKEEMFPSKEEMFPSKEEMYKSKDGKYQSKQEMSASKQEISPSKQEMYQSKQEMYQLKQEMYQSKEEKSKAQQEVSQSGETISGEVKTFTLRFLKNPSLSLVFRSEDKADGFIVRGENSKWYFQKERRRADKIMELLNNDISHELKKMNITVKDYYLVLRSISLKIGKQRFSTSLAGKLTNYLLFLYMKQKAPRLELGGIFCYSRPTCDKLVKWLKNAGMIKVHRSKADGNYYFITSEGRGFVENALQAE